MIVNLIDDNISYAQSYDDALEKGRKSSKIDYLKNLDNFDGITIFTDNKLFYSQNNASKYKVAWLMEPRAYSPQIYQMIEILANNFELILTYDEKILNMYPEKTCMIPADGIFIDSEAIFNKHQKTKTCSHIFSDKKILSGHKFRHTVADLIREKGYDVSLYGSGTGQNLLKKSDALRDYRFSIAVENNNDKYYITEKIYDCFATRTVPIYHGTAYVKECFLEDGILMFETLDDLEKIFDQLSENLYQSMLESIEENYQRVLKHYSVDEHIADALTARFGEV